MLPEHSAACKADHHAASESASVGSDLIDERGRRFCDRFVLRSRLGSGCSSSVYVVKEISGGEAACKLAQRRPKLRWSQLQAKPALPCLPFLSGSCTNSRRSSHAMCAAPLRARGEAAAHVRAPPHHRMPWALHGLRGPRHRAGPNARRRLPAVAQAARRLGRTRGAHHHGAALRRARMCACAQHHPPRR